MQNHLLQKQGITREDVIAHKANGSWRKLEQLAFEMVVDARIRAKDDFEPKLGGGTRLMLALEHRISDGVDLVIRDVQWIGCLTPRLNDRFTTGILDYEENPASLKLRYAEGEINFITAMSLLDLPDERYAEQRYLARPNFSMEPIAEVLAKKLFYRGWALTPRDLFDWWAISSKLGAIQIKGLCALLLNKYDDIQFALDALSNSPVARAEWDAIKTPNIPDIQLISDWGKRELVRYQQLAQSLQEGPSADKSVDSTLTPIG
jgi:hypothetical protein